MSEDIKTQKIIDYSNFNKAPWLLDTIKGSNVTTGIIEPVDDQLDELETVFYDMFTALGIDYATGEQLDVLGRHVVLSRLGLTDEEYRELLKAKVQVNVSSGEPEQIIAALKTLYGTDDVVYVPEYPAKFRVCGDGEIDEAAYYLLPQIAPSGVGVFISFLFVFDDGSYVVTDTGDYMVVTEEL